MFSWFKKKKKARQQPETRAKVDGELRPEEVVRNENLTEDNRMVGLPREARRSHPGSGGRF